MKNKLKNEFEKLLLVVVFVFFATILVVAQTSTATLNATQLTGKPGDKITFTYSVTGTGLKSKSVMMDGVPLEWTGNYTWTAIPGTHIFYIRGIYSNWDPMLEKMAIVEISGNSGGMNHPGLYNSQRELEEIRKNVNGEANHPMKKGWRNLLNSESTVETGYMKYSSLDWTPHPHKYVHPQKLYLIPGGTKRKPIEKMHFMNDMRAAYAHALMWVVTGEQEHADKSIEIYNAWANVYETIVSGSYYKHLYGSWMGNQVVMGAEIIRHYKNNGKSSGWKEKDIKKFEDTVVKDMKINSLQWLGSKGFYNGHNQPAAIARTRMALGVFLDDRALFDAGLWLLFNHIYNEKVEIKNIHGHYVNLVGLCIDKKGEVMEFNRGAPKGDPAHGTGTLNSLVNAAEIIRHQNVEEKYKFYDLKFTIDNDKLPRLLMGAEFAANSYLNSPNTKIRVNNHFKNKTVGQYSDMVTNYYKYISSPAYKCKLTEKACEIFRDRKKIGYIVPWTTLTHADLSKNIETGSANLEIKKEKSFSVFVSDEGKLQVNYLKNDRNIKIKVFDINGRVLRTIPVNGLGNYSTPINEFKNGIYFVLAQNENTYEVQKLMYLKK